MAQQLPFMHGLPDTVTQISNQEIPRNERFPCPMRVGPVPTFPQTSELYR